MLVYLPTFIPTNFIVVGAGGTGSRLVPLLSQFIKTANWIIDPRIYIIDYDNIEEKNLVRQNFIKLDLGKNKAAVLANRYGKAFDINITPIVRRIEHCSQNNPAYCASLIHEESLTLGNIANAILILCVDSPEARIDVLSNLTYYNTNAMLVIDAGNENDYGQVILYNPSKYVLDNIKYKLNQLETLAEEGADKLTTDIRLPAIPLPWEFYMSMKSLDTRNCAELDQTLTVNAMMATSIMSVIQNFLYSKPLSFHKLNISLKHGIQPEYLTFEYLYKTVEYGAKLHLHTSTATGKRLPLNILSPVDMGSTIKTGLDLVKEHSKTIVPVVAPKERIRRAREPV